MAATPPLVRCRLLGEVRPGIMLRAGNALTPIPGELAASRLPDSRSRWPRQDIKTLAPKQASLYEFGLEHRQFLANINRRTHRMDDVIVKDSNGAVLKSGDNVTLTKDLKVKGSSVTLKRGTLIKNIRLTDDPAEIECNADKVKGLVLKTCFLKKA